MSVEVDYVDDDDNDDDDDASDYDDHDTLNNLMEFCTTLVGHSQWKSVRVIHCGSRMENPTYSTYAKVFMDNVDKLDMDKMLFGFSQSTVSRSQLVPEAYTGDIVRIYTDNIHTGYVKLINEIDNTELLNSHQYELADDETLHGPAVLQSCSTNRNEILNKHIKYRQSNPVVDAAQCKALTITSSKQVFAMHSPHWPVQATEWITRRRSQGLPSKSIIRQVVRYGCDFVPVSHKLSNDKNDWRFSFSKAECFLIKNWTISQRSVIGTLWLIHKKIEGSHLCTYYFKTLMLWACEEKPSTFWRDDVLVHSVRELLIHMMTCLKLKFCLNYFMPGNNMMDDLIDTNLFRDIDKLLNASKEWWLLSSMVRCNQYCISNDTVCYELPAWIKRGIVIYDRMNSEEDTFKDLLRPYFQTVVSNALCTELRCIYSGIRYQKKAANCVHLEYYLLLKSSSHLTNATQLCESDKRDSLVCDQQGVRSIVNAFMLCTNEDEPSIASKHSDMLGSADGSNSSSDSNNQSDRVVASRKIHIVGTGIGGVMFYKEWPGKSPTVNISWFIAKAYLANLYYRTQRDVTLTLSTCDDIIDTSKLSYMNNRFAERAFPVVLSMQWADIYDKEIQALLGFHSLCTYIMTQGRSRAVYLGVCPVQFALYFKVRIGVETLACNGEIAVNKYIEHQRVCLCDQKINNGRNIIKYTLILICSGY